MACTRGGMFRINLISLVLEKLGSWEAQEAGSKAQVTLLLKSKGPNRIDSQKWYGGTSPKAKHTELAHRKDEPF